MTTGKRGPYKAGVARRERILDAASALFAADGFAKTTLADIARDAGVAAPSLKHYFDSKDDILTALAERRFETALAVADDSPADEDGTGSLRLMLRQMEIRAAQPELIEVFVRVAGFAADPASEAHALYSSRYASVVRRITLRFEAGVEAGHLRPGIDYEALARELIAVSDGLQLQWVLTRGGIDLVEMLRHHLERVVPEILVSGERVSLASAEPAPLPVHETPPGSPPGPP